MRALELAKAIQRAESINAVETQVDELVQLLKQLNTRNHHG
jgi:hypothetical protein